MKWLVGRQRISFFDQEVLVSLFPAVMKNVREPISHLHSAQDYYETLPILFFSPSYCTFGPSNTTIRLH